MASNSPAPLRSIELGGDVPGNEIASTKQLHDIYVKHIKPLEDMYSYDVFQPSWFEETILNPRPFVTFFGPWSSGKSTFMNYLLEGEYLRTGPQPTTSAFTVVVHGAVAGPLDGRVLANAKNLPFKGITALGDAFLEHFQGFQAPHPLLQRVTLIDTPGVLEAAQEDKQRRYDYVAACRWFVERSDLVFFLFDPTKLDAGAELRAMFTGAFKGQEGKLRIVLNKADAVDTQELMRVYGSVFWNLSNIISTTEPPRVYVGSFWDRPYNEGAFTLLFSEEKTDLLHELIEVVPQQARDRKIAQTIRRAKAVLTHAAIVGGMRSRLPVLFFKDKAKKKAMEDLPKTYEVVASQYKLNHADFPPVAEYLAFLEKFNLEKFPDIEKAEKRGLIAGIRECIDTTLPGMLRPVRNFNPANPHDGPARDDLRQRYRDPVIPPPPPPPLPVNGTDGQQQQQQQRQQSNGNATLPPVAASPSLPAAAQAFPAPPATAGGIGQEAMMAEMHVKYQQMLTMQHHQPQPQPQPHQQREEQEQRVVSARSSPSPPALAGAAACVVPDLWQSPQRESSVAVVGMRDAQQYRREDSGGPSTEPATVTNRTGGDALYETYK